MQNLASHLIWQESYEGYTGRILCNDGFIAGSPREVLKTSYKAELISDDTWMEMLKGGRLKPFYHISIPVDQKLRKVPLDIRGVTEIRLGAV